jgi:hypothetical protein
MMTTGEVCMPQGKCSNCPEFGELIKGECRACYQWRYRNGTTRPEGVVIEAARKFNDKQAERELLHRYVYEYGGPR